jgi:FtsP/CotA-like multicopper oxidase with cupredoxin domain
MTSADRPMVTRRQVLTGLSAGGAILAVGGLASCTSNGSSRRAAPDGATGPTSEFAQPNELSSSAGRLAVTLVAAPATVPYGDGRRWALTYNGSTPGPTLRVRPGDELTITLDNRLDTPTNLHTHGLHVSPEGDSDNVFVMVDPGQQHTYRYQIPPDHPSGTFWYHPHHHGQVAPQVFGGLAGAIIVEDAIDQLAELAAATSRVLVLADPNIGDSARVLDVSMAERMTGREGSAIVVNGLPQPRIGAQAGTVEHWRFINASPSRYYALRLDSHPFQLIGSDGGRLDHPQPIDELVLAPGERAEVLLPLAAPGTFALVTRPVDRGGMGMAGQGGGTGSGGMGGGMGRGATSGTTAVASTVIATLDVGGTAGAAPELPATLRTTADPSPDSVVRTRDVTLSMNMGMGGGGDRQFLIDGRSFDANRVDTTTRLGTTEDWIIHNTSSMDHPFHLHVWPFRVIERSDGSAPPPGWKDTVNVPAGQSVRLRIPFRDIAGRAVYHCHILDHEDLGMMGIIETRSQ